MLLPIVLLTATLAVAGSAHAQSSAAEPVPAARHFLWEVSSLTNRVYLYGTVHAGKASFYPLPVPVQKAFADAPILAVEADITNVEAMRKSAGTMLLRPGERLDAIVPDPVYRRLRAQFDRLGLPEPQVARLKPFMVSSVLAFAEWSRLGYLQKYGVDAHLISQAQDAGKKIVELEGAQAQAELIGSLTREQGLQALEGTLSALERGITAEQITGMVNAWQSGDPDLLLEVARAYNESIPGAKELEEKFIWSRHDLIAEKIEGWLMNGNSRVFIAVGALHLAGPRGLVATLGKRGYQVRQL
jgi:uncharacterized protein YbaP (TraB family)